MLAVLLGKFAHSKKDWAYLVLAMAFTLVSDFFLLLTDYITLGVATFWLAHTAYIFRVRRKLPKVTVVTLAVGLFFGVLLVLLGFPDVLMFFAAVYAVLFAQNIIVHVKYCKNTDNTTDELPLFNRKIILAALVLFALCDVNVAIFNLRDPLELSPQAVDIVYTLIWLFYVPSQLMLAISAVRFPRFLQKRS